ncbi:hypothetical protein AFUB_078880 [Aspergillus fumigatus A1163]|uniref:Uncharacterized protein n=1 Tax=Aspergillus fumigatus (strain CBS 144.89 / FGSC A1163 / CEA10) TaxID=451804 RepID=B0Y8X4_ASPFC|nr:hypothetical protein AFUB_078880 [Aspergillus fumigatus A1163]
MQLNQQSGLDTHTGTIDLTSIGSLWHAINGANSPEAKQASKRSLKSLCDLRGYPRAWRVFPPKHKDLFNRSPFHRSPFHRSLFHHSLFHRSLFHHSLFHRSLFHRSLFHRSLFHRSLSQPTGNLRKRQEHEK